MEAAQEDAGGEAQEEVLEESAEKDGVVEAQEEVLEEAWGVSELVQQL